MEHAYTPAIVTKDSMASRFVKTKATLRMLNGVKPTLVSVSNGVYHFTIPSATRNELEHRVEYDSNHKTFRCTCEGNFYGHHCTDIEIVTRSIHLR